MNDGDSAENHPLLSDSLEIDDLTERDSSRSEPGRHG